MSWLATGPYPQFSATPSTTASPSPSAQKQAAPAGKDKKPMPSSAPSSSAKGKAPVAAAAAAPAAAAASQDGTKQLQETILHMLEPREFLDTEQISKELSIDLQAATGAVSSLASKEMVITEVLERQEWVLTPEGKTIAEEGSHEAKVFYAVPAEGITQAELNAKLGESAKVGFGKALKSGWVSLKDGKITKATASVQDTAKEQLHGLLNDPSGAKIDKAVLADLKKRKLANNITIKSHKVTKGPQFATTITTLATDLDASMLASGSWKTQSYKAYNYNSLGLPTQGGQLHPLLKVREEFRNIFFEMGFTEMPTNNFVESSFWNFDTLFQPQQHPARDAHDTFFISDPEKATEFPEEYLQKVKTVHAEGGFGSLGYRYDWKLEEAQKNILRTHTTAVSARMLYKLAQEGEFHPVKYFSIDRVFRNEALDATHLAEFHQIEGLVADYDLSLSDLIGLLEAFFKKLGMTRLRFKPAYNPYTEPSMEIFAFHEGLGKWIEVGNSGVFRPEMLLPMGLPPSVSVIAWGVSLERPTMIKYAINNIRDLCGHKIDLHMVKKNPICRLDKN